jgi:hypothetical protein
MRQKIDIENLLRWAFTSELPKGGGIDGLAGMNSAWRMLEASSWGKIMSFAELGTLIDSGPKDGSRMFLEQGEPHRDALLVGEAVAGLHGVEIGGFDQWDAFGDRPDLAPHLAGLSARIERRLQAMPQMSRARLPVTLIVSAAVTGRAPDWRWTEEPKLRMVEVAGRPAWFVRENRAKPGDLAEIVEVDGYDPRRRRPKKGAYRKYEVTPDAFGLALSRADWQVWVACLNMLTEDLAGCLADWEVVPSVHTLTPWVEGVPSKPPLRVLEAV